MEFKEGEWIIRKWNRRAGGEVDFAYIREAREITFSAVKFYRFTEHEQLDLCNSPELGSIAYIDDGNRTEFDWRKATDEELIEYLILEPNPFNI